MPKANSNRNTAIDYLNRDIVNVKAELKEISKIVRDGNGQPPLIQQVATITTDLKHVNEELKREIDDIKEVTRHCREASAEKDRLSWQFKTAVWVALISSVTSIVLHFLSMK